MARPRKPVLSCGPLMKTAIVVALGLSVVTLAGCNKKESSEGSAPPAASSAPEISSAAASASAAAAASAARMAVQAKGRMRRHVGLGGPLLRAAYDLELDDGQRAALLAAEEEANAEKGGPATAIKALNADLAAGVRASKIDGAKLQADYAAIDKAVLGARDRESKAVLKLHDLLTPAQRQTLVEHVKAREVHRQPLGPDGGTPDLAKLHLARLTGQLGLDEAQKKSVGALLAKDPSANAATVEARRDAGQKDLEALLDAFLKDPFDGSKLAVEPGGAKNPHEMMQSHAELVAGMIPILHPDQREKLAVQTERQGGGHALGRTPNELDPGPPSMNAE